MILLAIEEAGCRARHMRNNALHMAITLSGSSCEDVILEALLVVLSCLFSTHGAACALQACSERRLAELES